MTQTRSRIRCSRWLAVPAISSFCSLLLGAGSVAQIARTELAAGPLQLATVDKPTMTLALSVEYPTVGALHAASSEIDDSYRNDKEFLGYHDADACYRYNDAPTEAVPPGMTASDLKRFDRIGPAANRTCSDGFSGNFLNWASSSAIDMLRMALSGGDRYVDTEDLTILQRAVVPDGNPVCMWNSATFPGKRLTRTGHPSQRYWGAVPAKMQAAAGSRDIWVANTLNRMYFGTAFGGSCSSPAGTLAGSGAGTNRLNSDNFFYARVQVCNVDANGVLQDVRNYDGLALCRQYPNGRYKPVGAIQRHGDQMRLAAFGYLMHWTDSRNTSRYGGVLRAPMKYVGFRTFDEHGAETTPAGGNARMEWDPQSGIFYANPDGDTTQNPRISGVINYLNKFGRTGPIPGLYKQFDPVGELHYEVIRYLQGMAPTPEAVSGLTAEMRDGFPAFTAWPDPFGGTRTRESDYSCLRNNIVVIGDIYGHDGGRLPKPSAANNVPDIAHWRSVVQAFEQGSAMQYVDGQGAVQTTGNPNVPNPTPPMEVHRSQILGSAYWARTHDIRGIGWTAEPAKQRPGLRAKTILFDVNEIGAGTAVGNTRRTTNQFFMAAKYGGFETQQLTPASLSYSSRGNPFRRDDGTADNDIWQKPKDPGEANAYYLQKDGRAVLNAFEDIFRRASQASRSIGGSGISSRDLSAAAGSLVYQGAFNAEDWTGDVLATRIKLSDGVVSVDANPEWSAAARMKELKTPASSRNIVVGRDGDNPATAATLFKWDQISAAQQAALNKASLASATEDGHGEQRLNYLRGDRSQEATADNPGAGLFRMRNGLLGDIVNAGVVYAGKPSAALNANGYAAFASASRRAAVYAGANDGMLHAFDAQDGSELFAYIPSWLVPQLPALTAKDYATHHRSYVDAPPTVGPADIGAGTPDWRMVLVGGTGGGGKGVYALDVSRPESFDASKVLWEFTQAHDADMGQVVGQPRILRMRTSARGATPRYKWFAVVASGVNNYVAGADGTSGDGRPALFLLDLAKPAGTAWALGTNYFKASVPIDTALAATVPPGLVNFKAELGVAGEVVRIYMGDLHGKLWRLDFDRANGTADWAMDTLSAFRTSYDGCSSCALPLYIARDANGNVQPITMAPTVAYSGDRSRYVVFGTGKYLTAADRARAGQQSYYALHDDVATPEQSPDTAKSASSIIGGRSRLKAGSVASNTRSISVPAFRWGRRTDALETARSDVFSGWYFDFPDDGERLISGITVNGNLLEFNTLYPPVSSICAGNGGSNAYAVNLVSGGGEYRKSAVGELSESMVLQIEVKEVNRHDKDATSASDSLGRRVRRTVTKTIDTGALGVAGAPKTTTQDIVVGRMSWRRIDNYQDLRQ